MIDTIQFVNGSAVRSGTSASAARENYDEVESLVVSLVVGCVVERDAISNICRQQMDAIANWARARGIPLQIRLYALHTDVSDSRIFRVPNVLSLVADDHFQRSDVVLFHFGIYYELFDAIQLAPAHCADRRLLPWNHPAFSLSRRRKAAYHTAPVVQAGREPAGRGPCFRHKLIPYPRSPREPGHPVRADDSRAAVRVFCSGRPCPRA